MLKHTSKASTKAKKSISHQKSHTSLPKHTKKPSKLLKSSTRSLTTRLSKTSPFSQHTSTFSTTSSPSISTPTTNTSCDIDPNDHSAIAIFPVITQSHLKKYPNSTHSAALEAKRDYEAKLQALPFRWSQYLKDPSAPLRASLLAIPAFGVMAGAHDLSLYLSSIVDSVSLNESTTKNALMCFGAVQATLGYSLFHNVKKILTLSRTPSEEEIQEMIRHTLGHPQLKLELGGGMALGHFVSVSTAPGKTGRLNSRRLDHYKQWLLNDPNQLTSPLPEIPVPTFFQKYLSLFPAFQTVAWNQRVTEKIQKDIQEHPEDYISDSESDQSTSSESETDAKVVPEPTANPDTVPEGIKFIQPRQPWTRIWKPRRIQFAAHLKGHMDEGLLLCEIENFKYGPDFKAADSIAQYKVFDFVSLTTGSVLVFNRLERPSMMDPKHVQQLAATVPEPHPVVSVASFDHILVEDKMKKQVKQYVASEKKKVDVGIYH